MPKKITVNDASKSVIVGPAPAEKVDAAAASQPAPAAKGSEKGGK